MNVWDFLRWLLDQHPRMFFVGSIGVSLLVAHVVLNGLTINICRNVIPFKMPVDEGLKLPKLEPKK